MLLNNNDQKEKKFDVIQSQFDAYKRWGYAVEDNHHEKKSILNETENAKGEKEQAR